jgi:hypothetical protein
VRKNQTTRFDLCHFPCFDLLADASANNLIRAPGADHSQRAIFVFYNAQQDEAGQGNGPRRRLDALDDGRRRCRRAPGT